MGPKWLFCKFRKRLFGHGYDETPDFTKGQIRIEALKLQEIEVPHWKRLRQKIVEKNGGIIVCARCGEKIRNRPAKLRGNDLLLCPTCRKETVKVARRLMHVNNG